MTKDDIGWSHGNVATKDANLTNAVGAVTRAGDVLLVDVQVDATVTCYNRQQVDLVQASLDERRGAFA